MLKGKTILITGVATPHSIAAATAARCLELGAQVALTAFPRDLDAAAALGADLDPGIAVHPLDLTDLDQLTTVAYQLGEQYGRLDGVLHAVAYAPPAALTGTLTDTDPAAVELAFRTSTWTLATAARLLGRLAPRTGASLVALDFDADSRAWPVYNWMGVCKTALGATARYLARDLGPQHIRTNLVAAGPLHTRAANAIPGFDQLLHAWATTSPLPWNPHDPTPVADTICFLLSDLARAITGETIHVDSGYHAMAAPLR